MPPGAGGPWIATFGDILVPRIPGLQGIEELAP
jgi:hypothetical protein